MPVLPSNQTDHISLLLRAAAVTIQVKPAITKHMQVTHAMSSQAIELLCTAQRHSRQHYQDCPPVRPASAQAIFWCIPNGVQPSPKMS